MKTLVHRSRLRHTRRADDEMAVLPPLPPASSSLPLVASFYGRLSTATTLLAQIECLGDLKGTLSHNRIPVGAELSGIIALALDIAVCVGCSSLLRPALTLLLAARGVCPQEVDRGLHAALLSGEEGATKYNAGVSGDEDADAVAGAAAVEAAHRVFLWVALLEDGTLRARLLTPVLQGSHSWHATPLSLAMGAMDTSMGELAALDWGRGTAPVVTLSACDAVTAALKLFSLLVSFIEGLGQGGLITEGTEGGAHCSPSAAIGEHCRELLGWKECSQELRTAAAVALGAHWCAEATAVTAAALSPSSAAAAVAVAVAPIPEGSSPLHCLCTHRGGEGGEGEGSSPGHWVLTLPRASRLALVRGVLIAAPPALLLSTPTPTQPYLLTVWPQIEAALVSPDLGDRLSAVQLCETWLAALRRGVKAEPSHALALATPTLLLVLKYLLLNWQSPTRRLTTLVSEVFQSLQTTLWTLRVIAEGAGVPMPPQLIPQAQLEVAFDLPFGGVPWCHALQCIIRGGLKEGGGGGGTTPTLHLLETHPTLLPTLMLLTCTELENSSLRSSTLSVVLCSARVELEVEAGLVGGEQGGAAQAWQKRGVAPHTIAALRACFYPGSASGHGQQGKQDGVSMVGGGGGEVAKKVRVKRRTKGVAGGPGAPTLSQELLSRYPTLGTHLAPWGTWNPMEGLGEMEAEVVRVDQQALMASLKEVLLGAGCVAEKEGEGESEEEGGWVAQVYRECAHASVYFAWLHLWLPHTLALLVDPRRDVRMRGDAFIAREGVGMDAWTWGIVHRGLGGLIGGGGGEMGRGDDGCTLSERAIAGIVAILKTARSAGFPVLECDREEVAAVEKQVQQQQLVPLSTVQQWGCSTPDPEARVSVMELLAAAQSSIGHPPTRAEYHCAASVFASNTTLPLWELRKRATRAFSKFLARALAPRGAWVREDEKRASKAAAAASSKGRKKSSTAQALGGVGEGGLEETHPPPSSPPDTSDLSKFLSTIIQAMLASLYPGSPLERASLAMAFLTAAAEALPPSPPLRGEAVSIAATLDPALASPRLTSYLINLLGDPQESLRASAGALLIGHCGERGRGSPSQPSPSPFPGIDTPQSLEGVLVYALRLTSSLRDRESGAGAALLHAIFLRYVCDLGWDLTLYPHVQVRECVPPQQSMATHSCYPAVATFLTQLHAVLQARVRALRGAMGELLGLGEGGGGDGDAAALTAADSPSTPPHPPTPHGVAFALRLCCLSALGKGAGGGGASGKWGGSASSSTATPLPSIITMVLSSLEELMQLSLLAVAGGGDSDGGLEMSASAPSEGGGEEEDGEGDLGEEDGEEEGEGEEEEKEEGGDGADESVLASGRVDCSAGGKVWAKGLLRHLRPKPEAVGGGSGAGSGRGAAPPDSTHKTPQLHGPVSNSVGAYVGGGVAAGGDLHSALRGTSGTAAAPSSSSPSGASAEIREVSLPHAVIVACWLASREGTRAREGILNALPLPTAAAVDGGGGGAAGAPTPEVFTHTLWGFLRALLTLRHVGSIAAVTSAVQTLVGRLLTAPAIHPKLSKWPSQALSALLQALMGAKEFILRRSAGFGFAFLAILRSEPRNATAQLLPRAINTLLVMAGCPVSVVEGEGGEGGERVGPRPRPRTVIHALNILCLLFKDSSLGEACSRFLYPALATALLGFSSPSWAIRNSSMMLFAAVSDRALGTEGKNSGASPPATLLRHGGKDTRTLASEFFSRNPPILALLLKHLKEGVAPSGATATAPAIATDGGGGSLAGAPLHPQLFPVLLLFSRLQGGGLDGGEEEELCASAHPLSPLLPLLLPLLSHRHSFIRGLAGGVVASIPHPTQAVGALSQALLKGIGGDSGGSGSSCSNNNARHGALTATRTLVSRLLREGCINPTTTLAPLRQALLSFAPPLLANPTALPLLKAEALLALYEVGVGGGEEAQHGLSCRDAAHQASLSTLPLTGLGAKGIGGAVFTRAAGGVALHLSLLKCIKQGVCGAGALSPLTHPNPDTRQGAWKSLKTVLKHHSRLLPQGIPRLFTLPSSGSLPTTLGEELFALALGGEGWGGAAMDAVPIINSYRLHTVALLAPHALSTTTTTTTTVTATATPSSSSSSSNSPPSSTPPLPSTTQRLIQHPKSWGFSLAVCALGSRVDAKVRLHALASLGYLLSSLSLALAPISTSTPSMPPPAGEACAGGLAVCVEAAVKELCGVGGVGGVGGDREASTHHTLRAKALGALGRSGVLRSPWTHPTTPTATLALGTAWPALLLALTDGDDEVREGARVVTLDALGGAGDAVVSYTLVSMASGEFLGGAPREVRALLPIPSPISSVGGALLLPLQGLCDRGALVAAHIALTLACALGGGTASSLVGAMCRATLAKCFEGGLVGVEEVGEGVAKVAAAAAAAEVPSVSTAGAFDPSMLHRATFLPCSTANGFAEDLLTCGLAGGLWVHLHKRGVPSVVGAPLTPLASTLIQRASSLELPTHPFLTHTQGWSPEGACVDHFPTAFAPCRVAECVVAGEAEGQS